MYPTVAHSTTDSWARHIACSVQLAGASYLQLSAAEFCHIGSGVFPLATCRRRESGRSRVALHGRTPAQGRVRLFNADMHSLYDSDAMRTPF